MATVIISNLPPAPPITGSGDSQGTDIFPATDVTDHSASATGTTKKYTLSEIYNWMLTAAGLTTYEAVRAATTSALTVVYDNGTSGVGATLTNAGAQTALVIDGVTLVATNRVLVKDQVSTFQNGIYTVTNVGTSSTNWVLTRATDYDSSSEVVYHGVVLINQGATYAGLLYQEISPGPFVIGSSAITFAQFTSQSISFPVLLSQGGTSAALTADNGGIFYSNATTGAILAGTSTAGQMLQSGATAAPSWSTPTYPSASGISGTILRSNGTNNIYSTATFSDTYTASNLLYSNGANTVIGLATSNSGMLTTNGSGVPAITTLSAGQVFIGTTGSAPTAAAISSGTGIIVANGSGTITISATGGGLATIAISGTTQTAVVSTKYIALNALQTTLTLPAIYAVGDVVSLIGSGTNTGGWIVQAHTGDTICVNGANTSVGGSVSCTGVAGQCIEFVCDVANTSWVMESTVSVLLTTA